MALNDGLAWEFGASRRKGDAFQGGRHPNFITLNSGDGNDGAAASSDGDDGDNNRRVQAQTKESLRDLQPPSTVRPATEQPL